MSHKILLVDDDPDFQAQVQPPLEALGYKVLAAETVEAARQIITDMRLDLAIVDLMLDHLDSGFALCYWIKKLDPRLPVILVSSVRSKTDMEFDVKTDEERSWIKADVWLDKPIRFETLHKEIVRLIPEYLASTTDAQHAGLPG